MSSLLKMDAKTYTEYMSIIFLVNISCYIHNDISTLSLWLYHADGYWDKGLENFCKDKLWLLFLRNEMAKQLPGKQKLHA